MSKDQSTTSQTAAVDPQIAKQFGLVFASIGDALTAAAGALGRDGSTVSDAVAKFVVDIPRASLRGLKGTDLQDAINALISTASDQIAASVLPGLAEFTQIGEGYLQTVVRVATGVEAAQVALEKLGVGAVSFAAIANKQGDVAGELVRQSIAAVEATTGVGKLIAVFGGSATEIADAYAALVGVRNSLQDIGQSGSATTGALVRGAGGLQALQDSLKSFQDDFLSDSERLAIATVRVGDQFNRLGFALPTSGAAFVSLVRGIDTSTDAGQKLLGQVLALSDGFSSLSTQVKTTGQERASIEQTLLQAQGNTVELRRRELAALTPANRELQQRVFDLADAQEAASQATKLRDAWKAVGATIASEVERILGLAGSQSQTLAGAQGAFAIATAQARAGDQEAAKTLPTLSRAMLDLALTNASSAQDLALIRGATAASLSETAALVQAGGDAAAIKADGLVAALKAAGILTTTEATVTPISNAITDGFNHLFSGLKTAFSSINSAINGSGSKSTTAIQDATNGWGDIGGFASGGSHAGGLRIVGENGPELEFTGPARIWSAPQTAQFLASAQAGQGDNGATAALIQEVASLRAELQAIASHTAKTARQLARWDGDGMPATVAA